MLKHPRVEPEIAGVHDDAVLQLEHDDHGAGALVGRFDIEPFSDFSANEQTV